MKNKILMLIGIAIMTGCSSGGSGSASGAAPNLTSPSVPDNVNAIPANELFKSDSCFDIGGGASGRVYFTKISGDEVQIETDQFGGPNCEDGTPPIIVFNSTKLIAKITGYSASTVPEFQVLTLRQEYLAFMPLDQNFADNMAATYAVNGPWVVGEYHNMSGETGFSVNGTLSTSEIKYVGGLLTLGGNTFQ